MAEPEVLSRFVRETLGCGCPEPVLRQISRRPPPPQLARCGVSTVLDVGGRLLVLVLRPTGQEAALQMLGEVTAAAVRARDGEGFNRVRLVMVTDDPERTEAGLQDEFERLRHGDDRLHLHLLAPHQMEDLEL